MSLRSYKAPLDAIDVDIIRELAADARIGLAALARKVGMSAPSVSERIKRLEDVGAISGYSAVINPEAIGLPLAAYLRIRPIPGQLKTVADLLRNLPLIVSCDRITGEDCFIARAHLSSVAELEDLIDRINPFAMTNTSIIQSSPVPPRLPPITPDMPATSRRRQSNRDSKIRRVPPNRQ